MGYIEDCLEFVFDGPKREMFFLVLILSFCTDSDNFSTKSLRSLWPRKLIIVSHILFILLVITDIVLTPIYTSSIPLYTATIPTSFQWAPLNAPSDQLIIYILFGGAFAVTCGCCCFCAICCLSCIDCIQKERSDGTYSLNGVQVYAGCIHVVIFPFIAALILVPFIAIFCVSPALLLYIFLLIYTLANGPRLIEHRSYSLGSFREIASALNCIYKCKNQKIRRVYHRLAQYLIGYMLWPINSNDEDRDKHYDKITQKLLHKFNELYEVDIEESMDNLNTRIHVVRNDEAENIVNAFVNDEGEQLKLPELDTNCRTKSYMIFCIYMYIFITTAFWLCYGYSNYEGGKILFQFYVASYSIYFVLLLLNIWLSWKLLGLYLRLKYGWLLRMYCCNYWYRFAVFYQNGNHGIGNGKYTVDELFANKFQRLYHVILYQYMISQCVKKLFEHNYGWMSDLILEYLFIEDVEQLISDVEQGNADKNDDEDTLVAASEATGPCRYWYPYSYYDIRFVEFVPVMSAKFDSYLKWKRQNPSIFKMYDL